MKWLYKAMDGIRELVRLQMTYVAKGINTLSGGRIEPNHITLFGLLMHLPIAWLIAQGYFLYAAGLLVVFGLFDALDGALARLQKRASPSGMLLDASTDRMKEVMLYSGAAYALAVQGYVQGAAVAVAACGASLCVSYVKAKGETAVKDANLSANEINRLFQDGLARFEVRMLILIVGLVSNYLFYAVVAVALLATITAFGRLYTISNRLNRDV